jgi:hypothetical protein
MFFQKDKTLHNKLCEVADSANGVLQTLKRILNNEQELVIWYNDGNRWLVISPRKFAEKGINSAS